MAGKAKYKKNYRGLFETRVSDGHGGRQRITSSISSSDLERKVAEYRLSVRNGESVIKSDITFIEYARQWLKIKKAGREHNTKAMYYNIIEKHLLFLEGIRLIDIRNSHFQLAISNAIDHPRTCQQIQITFKQIIKAACNDNLITEGMAGKIYDNIELPKYIKSDKRPLTETESQAVKELLKTDIFTSREKAFIYLIMGCGLRRQEALALQPFNFDFKLKTVSIRSVVIFDGNNPKIKPIPKSESGIRTIPVPDKAINFFKQYILNNQSYLFTNKSGSLISKSGYDKMWKSIVDKINVKMGGTDSLVLTSGLTAHTFRHNYCTELCYQIPTISTKKIAALLGDKEKMVLDVYSHIIEGKENAAEAVEKAINF